MSWSQSKSDIAPADIAALDLGKTEVTDGEQEQFDLAKEVAAKIVDSGALGKVSTVNVGLSGHANPNHERTEGYANDMINVSLSVAYYEGDPHKIEEA